MDRDASGDRPRPGDPAAGWQPPPGQGAPQPGWAPAGPPAGPPGQPSHWAPPPGVHPGPGGPPPGAAPGPPPRPGWGAPPPARRSPRVSGLAIIAMVAAVAGLFVPVVVTIAALVMAILAARAIRRSGGALTGRGLAYTAGITAGLVLVINAVTVAGIVRAWPQISEGLAQVDDVFGIARGVAEGRIVEANLLKEGDCYLLPIADDYTLVERVDCGTPHDGEVFAVVPLDHQAYPGEEALREEVGEVCDRRPESADPSGEGEIEILVVAPDEVRWGNGVRSGLCSLVPAEGAGKLVGSRRAG